MKDASGARQQSSFKGGVRAYKYNSKVFTKSVSSFDCRIIRLEYQFFRDIFNEKELWNIIHATKEEIVDMALFLNRARTGKTFIVKTLDDGRRFGAAVFFT